jgi:polysaccharide export outer membrane protein
MERKWVVSGIVGLALLCLGTAPDAEAHQETEPATHQEGANENRPEAAPVTSQEETTENPEVGGAPPAYRVGAGDVLDVTVYDEPDLSRLFTIQYDGEMSFPLVGEIVVSGKTVGEVQQLLVELLEKDYLVNPQVSVKVKEFRSQWVNLVGETVRPGRYYLDGTTTLLELLTEAGGFTPHASGEVIVSRLEGAFENGDSIRRVWLSREMSPTEQQAALSMHLSSGDLVTVSTQAFVFISGEVKNPGSYPLTSGLTVLKMVSLSGGLSKFGSKGKVEILRKNGDGKPEKIKIDLSDIENGKKPDVPLIAGDIVKVGKRIF